MGMQESTGALDYARNEYIKQGRSHIFDRVGDMIYYSCLAHYGKDYWVDGTNGLDTNSGRSMNNAVKKIGQAITLSNADITLNANHNNRIYIIGGTYTENLTGATNCDLIGLDVNRRGWSPRIAGTLTATGTTGMRIFDVQLMATATADEAVILAGSCANFELHRCELRAFTGSTGYGLHVTGNSFYVKVKNCRFTNCWHTGIYIDTAEAKAFEFEENWINASTTGIYIAAGFTTSFDSIIKANVITRSSHLSNDALAIGIDFADVVRVPRVMVIGNWIAADDGIHYGQDNVYFWDNMACIDNHIVKGTDGTGAIETSSS